MENTNDLTKKLGFVGRILKQVVAHTVYPQSVTELKENSSKIKYDSNKIFFKNTVLASLNCCYFSPINKSVGKISDLETEIEINVANKKMPEEQFQMKHVLLKYTPSSTTPELIKYK